MSESPATGIEPRQLGERCCDGDVRGSLSGARAEKLARTLEALAHPVRLQILDALAAHPGKVCVCDLDSLLPVKQPTVSHHLRLLREAGLVHHERRGQWMYYFVNRKALGEIRREFVDFLGQAGGKRR
jgi:ArsR family transcriptional regulator